jgi:ribose-phosphate pyrophosphokinase
MHRSPLADTGGTLCTLARKLKELGAKDIYVYASHALFNGDALELIAKSPIKKVYVTNTIGHSPEVLAAATKVEQVSIGPHLAKLIYAEHCRSAEIFKEEYEVQ